MAGVKPLLETIGALLPKGIKAWHASPHDFDKVDLSKIGTGQGAASYGPGFYAAESPKVSGQGGEYWKEFLRHFPDQSPEHHAASVLQQHGFNREAAIADTRKNIDDLTSYLATPKAGSKQGWHDIQGGDDYYRKLLALREQQLAVLEKPGGQVGPRVYELNLKADPKEFIDWDKPLIYHSQPKAAEKFAEEAAYQLSKNPTSMYPQEAIPVLTNRRAASFSDDARMKGGLALANEMRDAGIPGVRYADAASRNPVASKGAEDAIRRNLERFQKARESNAPQWEQDYFREAVQTARDRKQRELDAFPRTYNYVINNPDIIEIMRKLAIPGMVTGGAATAYQPQGQR